MTIKDHITNSFSDADFWIYEWLKSSKRSSDHTHTAYKKDINSFLERAGKAFNEIKESDIARYQSDISNQAPRTQARKLASVRSFYSFLNSREVTSLNLDMVEKVKIQRQVDKRKFLTEEEIEAIIESAKSDNQTQIFVRFLYLTATRISEALSLRWRDCKVLWNKNGGQLHIIGKGQKPRDIFLPNPLWNELIEFRDAAADSDYLFPTLTPLEAWRLVKKLAKSAKIDKKVTPHSFRHAHLSHALSHGATLAELRDQAGHADISTTSLYLHANPERATATRLKIQ